MTTFDASTGHRPVPAPEDDQGALNAALGGEEMPDLGSMLDQLQDQLQSREIDNTVFVEVPGMDLRFVCQVDFPYSQYAKWQKAALPPNKRNARKMNPFDLDQAIVAVFVLLGTCIGMEYRAGSGEWLPMMSASGPALLPTSTDFLSRFNQVDAKSFVRKLFGGDAGVMRAADRVTRAAGWTDESAEDEDDPLV